MGHTQRKKFHQPLHKPYFLCEIKLKNFYLSQGIIKWGNLESTAWFNSWKCSTPSTCATYSFKLKIKRDNAKETGYKIWIDDLLKIQIITAKLYHISPKVKIESLMISRLGQRNSSIFSAASFEIEIGRFGLWSDCLQYLA